MKLLYTVIGNEEIEDAIDYLTGHLPNDDYMEMIINHYLFMSLKDQRIDVPSVYFNCKQEQYLECYRVVEEFSMRLYAEVDYLRAYIPHLVTIGYMHGLLMVGTHT